jgi:hypothetical protein
LPYFFEFPPAEISFLVVKGVFWWFDCHTWQRRWGFAQAAKPPRYAPSTRVELFYEKSIDILGML